MIEPSLTTSRKSTWRSVEKRWLEHFTIFGVLITLVYILYRAVHQITIGKYAMRNMAIIQHLAMVFLALIKTIEKHKQTKTQIKLNTN